MESLLVSTAYMPPVDYLCDCVCASRVVVDSGERYEKQTYRNRCEIGTSQGRLPLIVPVVRPLGHLTQIDAVRVDYATDWVRNHLGAIRSAYARTPFFEHYFPELESLIAHHCETLLELNLRILRFLLAAFQTSAEVTLEAWGTLPPPVSYHDGRKAYHPKRARPSGAEYYQPFSDRLPFLPHLSAIDLLFNEGPNAAVARR